MKEPEYTRVIIGIGSNIRPRHYIPLALKYISECHHFVSRSRFIKTSTVGFKDQPDFINGSILIETRYSRQSLEEWLKLVELRLDRIRTPNKFGPRTIDLDIAVWNGKVVDPNVFTRDYLRQSIHELCPGLHLDRS